MRLAEGFGQRGTRLLLKHRVSSNVAALARRRMAISAIPLAPARICIASGA